MKLSKQEGNGIMYSKQCIKESAMESTLFWKAVTQSWGEIKKKNIIEQTITKGVCNRYTEWPSITKILHKKDVECQKWLKSSFIIDNSFTSIIFLNVSRLNSPIYKHKMRTWVAVQWVRHLICMKPTRGSIAVTNQLPWTHQTWTLSTKLGLNPKHHGSDTKTNRCKWHQVAG